MVTNRRPSGPFGGKACARGRPADRSRPSMIGRRGGSSGGRIGSYAKASCPDGGARLVVVGRRGHRRDRDLVGAAPATACGSAPRPPPRRRPAPVTGRSAWSPRRRSRRCCRTSPPGCETAPTASTCRSPSPTAGSPPTGSTGPAPSCGSPMTPRGPRSPARSVCGPTRARRGRLGRRDQPHLHGRPTRRPARSSRPPAARGSPCRGWSPTRTDAKLVVRDPASPVTACSAWARSPRRSGWARAWTPRRCG